MAKLECELQGDFDDILLDIERGLIVDEESSSDTTVGGRRCVVRTYSVGVNLTLMETGSSIRLTAVNADDSSTGFALGLSTYSQNFYLDAIKDAVDKYRADRENDAYINPIDTYLGTTSFGDKAGLNANTETKIISTEKSKQEKEIKLSCACLQKNKKELHKSITRYCNDVLCLPLSEVTRRISLNNERTLVKSIASKFKAVFKSKDYDYEMMVKGFCNIIFGIGGLVASKIIMSFRYSELDSIKRQTREMWFQYEFWTVVGGLLIVIILVGVLYILKPTQILFQKKDWELYETRFIYSQPIAPVGLGIFDQDNKGIEKTDEMILYNNRARFCSGVEIITLGYSDMEGIFETENFFVIMVRSDCIYSFQKCDMRQEVEQQVREMLSPYYKAVSE